MFQTTTYENRRRQLIQQFSSGLLLFMGNKDSPMNYKANTYRFRQDSNFLYYFGIDQPGLAAVIDIDENTITIFGNELTVEQIVWIGQQTSLKEKAVQVGVHQTSPSDQLTTVLGKASQAGRTIHYLPPYRAINKIKLHHWLNLDIEAVEENYSTSLVKAVIAQRSVKDADEIIEMEKAVNTSRAMHVAAMRFAKAGMKESEVVGVIKSEALAPGGDTAYPIIFSVNGQILHNHYHGNTLQEGQLVLGDFGAETKMCYAGDITRTFPVSKEFTQQQKEIYQIVLDAQVACIDALAPGKSYKDIHLLAAKIKTDGLKNLGIMKGDTEAAVNAGAHALFFPHGLGHMIGLDVHDMEDLGENLVGYSENITRSDQFGLAYLRLGKKLESGYVLTVEPGLYFIPELIDQWRAANKFTDFINYEKLETYRQFGGIRIEDNVLITDEGHRILGDPIPKTIEEVESLRG